MRTWSSGIIGCTSRRASCRAASWSRPSSGQAGSSTSCAGCASAASEPPRRRRGGHGSRSRRLHAADYLAFLETAWDEWMAAGVRGEAIAGSYPARRMQTTRPPRSIDGKVGYHARAAETAITAGTWRAALSSAASAQAAARDVAAASAGRAYALCRPPGHHAARTSSAATASSTTPPWRRRRLRDAGFGAGGGARRGLPPRQRHPGHLLGARRRALRLAPRRPRRPSTPTSSATPTSAATGRARAPTLQLPAAARHRWARVRAALEAALRRIAAFAPRHWWCRSAWTPSRATRSAPSSSPPTTTRDGPAASAALRLPTVFVQEGGYAVRPWA